MLAMLRSCALSASGVDEAIHGLALAQVDGENRGAHAVENHVDSKLTGVRGSHGLDTVRATAPVWLSWILSSWRVAVYECAVSQGARWNTFPSNTGWVARLLQRLC